MRYLTATAAALIFSATPVLAQQAASATTPMMSEADNGPLIRTRDITGAAIYTTNEAHDDGFLGPGRRHHLGLV